jgi:hypothetical protein
MPFYNRLLLLTVLLAACLSCRKKHTDTEIILEYPLFYTYTLEPDYKLSDTLVITETIDIQDSIESFLDRNNSSIEKIKSVQVIRLNLYQYNMDTSRYTNFRDFSDLSLYMYHIIPGQKKIAHKLVPDIAAPVLIMDPEDTELREYLVNRGSSLMFAYMRRRPSSTEMPLMAYMRLKIVTQPL